MPVTAAVQLHLSTKDPREAIAECLHIVRANTVNVEGLQIDLGLVCSANCEVLKRLAERLPSTALGFSMGLGRQLSASQFQSVAVQGICTFNGSLTEHFLPADVFILIEQLLQSPPRPIRSTAFNLNVRNVLWKGAPEGATGSLNLFDLKAFNRADRFSLSVSLQVSSDDPKSAEVRDLLKRVTQATGIPFDGGKVVRVLGEKGRSADYAQAVLVGQVCFEEAIESVATQLPKKWTSEYAPHALSSEDAFQHRFQQLGTGSSSKVSLPSVLKRAVKQRLPEFKSAGADANQILFAKRIARDLEILFVFQKAMPRIGKAFTLSLGVRAVAQQMRFTENIFQLDGTTEQRTWIYGDADEADEAAKEALQLGTELLPRFEATLKEYFEPWPNDFPAGIDRYGNLTALEAFSKAEPLARKLFSDAALIRVHNHPRSVMVRDIQGPELSLDGRLVPHALWWFHFYSAEQDASFQVTVPALGRIRILDHGKQYQNVNARYILAPLHRNWMDSDRAFALAEERGGRKRRGSGKTFGLFAKLQMSRSERAYWAFMFGVVDERGRNDLIVNMDAATGEPLDDIQGF